MDQVVLKTALLGLFRNCPLLQIRKITISWHVEYNGVLAKGEFWAVQVTVIQLAMHG